MMDSDRRTILTTGAAVAATAAVPQVFAQQGGQEGGATSFYKKSNVIPKIRGPRFPRRARTRSISNCQIPKAYQVLDHR